MRFLQSLWTGTSKFHLDRNAAMIWSASVAALCDFTSDTELVTDKRGCEIAERLGWRHAGIKIALDGGFCADDEKRIWSLGKIRAQEIQPRHIATAHIDLDFFLKDLSQQAYGSPAGAQSQDPLEFYRRDHVMSAIAKAELSRTAVPYNCGFISFTDGALRSEYAARSYRAASILARAGIHGTDAAIISEQVLFGTMMEERSMRPFVLSKTPAVSIHEDFTDNKFRHLWGRAKSRSQVLTKTEAEFERLYPDQYRDFLLGFHVLLNKGYAQ